MKVCTCSLESAVTFLRFRECPESFEPAAPLSLQVPAERADCLAPGPIPALLPPPLHRDETSLAQDAKVLRDRTEGDGEPARDISGTSLCLPDQAQDVATARFGEDSQEVSHDSCYYRLK